MGDANQRLFLERHMPRADGPVIEIGSKDYGSTASFRDLYAGVEYVGADLEAGKGVDVVVDLAQGLGGLGEAKFALAICCSVLEHTPRPWVMAHNITRLLRPGGALFPHLLWTAGAYSTNVPGDSVPLDLRDIANVDNAMAITVKGAQQSRKYLPYLMVDMPGRRSVEAG